jgi:magnesium transporter
VSGARQAITCEVIAEITPGSGILMSIAPATVPPDSAVTSITTKFLSVGEEETAGEIKKLIASRAKELEVIDYVYVVDENRFLHGVASLKDVLQAHDDVPVKKIMKRKLVTADMHADQERIIYLVLKNKLKSIPVVDTENHLSGVVSYDAILNVFHHEFREDILKSGGIHHHIKEIEDIDTPVSRLVKARLPSLALGLIGGLLAAFIVSGFEGILSSYFVLASFIPVMIYLSDAVGTQSQTLIVRMIALEPGFSVKRYVTREVQVGGILGAVFASLLFAAASLGWGPLQAGAIIGLSMLVSIVFQSLISTYLSISLVKFNVDPAVASGPLTTIISDITTLTLYFGIASLLLRFF